METNYKICLHIMTVQILFFLFSWAACHKKKKKVDTVGYVNFSD